MMKKTQHKKLTTAGQQTAHTQPKQAESRRTHQTSNGTRLVSVKEVNELRDKIVKKLNEDSTKNLNLTVDILLRWIRK